VAAAEFERPNEVEMTKAVTIYGIKNCDTMKKARAWLDQRGVAYGFHDYKSAGIDRGMLERCSTAPAPRFASGPRRTRTGSRRRRRSR